VFNLGKYSIVEKHYSGIEVSLYTIEDEDGKRDIVKSVDVIQLVKQGIVKNAKYFINTYNNEDIISIENEINVGIREASVFEIKCILINDVGAYVGYRVTNKKNKTYDLSSNKVWELALDNLIKDTEAVMQSKYRVLRMINERSLSDIPKIIVK
jgi:hypothetical protein